MVLLYPHLRPPERRLWPLIPAGTYTVGSPEAGPGADWRRVTVAAFRMQRTEVTVGQFVRYLNLVRPDVAFDSPQIRLLGNRYQALVPRRSPVAYVTMEDAQGYARWLSQRRRGTVRLPSADEWEIAARSGLDRTRYPWGWADPVTEAHFDAEGPARVARYRPNAFGLYDMAGNVAEWVLGDVGSLDQAWALGGSWAERDPDFLRVFTRVPYPRTYRDADLGFRVIQTDR